MRMLIVAAALLLSAVAARAEAPCENPLTTPCQRACAMMGAKYILSMSGRAAPAPIEARTVAADDRDGDALAVQRLARLAGVSLDYIDGLTLRQVTGSIAAYCPR